MPASEISASAWPSREPRQRLGAGALGVVLVIGAERRGDAVVVEQAARMAGVLGEDQIDAGEDLQRRAA